ncbi:MAG: hypothetical protein JXA73_05005 [Acidobacteria bacterium]|nr:hypothetical protein [Acidobacteriota bacterium]
MMNPATMCASVIIVLVLAASLFGQTGPGSKAVLRNKPGIDIAVIPQIVGDMVYKLHGINFSPYTDGQDPNRRSSISPGQLRERMSVVAPYTSWIRTFGSSDGLEDAGPAARQLGLKIAAGAWLSRDRKANQREIANLIGSMKAGFVDVAVVGSEVLLRNDLSESELIQYIQQLKREAPGIPVTTADVYSRLAVHPALVAACDQLFVNYYPYWEGIRIDNAVTSIHRWQQQVEAVAQGKPVIVSETGWPSCGNQIGDAVASPENAAFFFLNFVSWARGNKVPFFYFEAFDEDWKKAYEGPQGECWGVWNRFGKLKAGMQNVFAGKILLGNWTVKPSPDRGTAVIEFTSVPPLETYGNLSGRVTGVNPKEHKVAVYIYVGSGWWTKPYFNQPLTTIQADGNWTCDITTGGIDQQATKIAAFVVPNGYEPPLASGAANLPAAIEKSSVAKVIAARNKP